MKQRGDYAQYEYIPSFLWAVFVISIAINFKFLLI